MRLPALERTANFMLIVRLQYMRAIAAFSVMFFHASFYLNSNRDNAVPFQFFGYWFGNFGVTLFFAISGYLMAMLANRTDPVKFLAHRLIRIYPIYWIVASLNLCFRYIIHYGPVFDPLAFGLIPGGPHYYLLGVEWTLPFELTFYMIVFLVILFYARRILPHIAAAWFFSISIGLIFFPSLQHGQFPTLLYIPFQAKTLAFAGGLLVPLAVEKGLVFRRVIGVAIIVLIFSALVFSRAQPWTLALGCILLVSWAVRDQENRNNPTNIGVYLGDWSFALYLVHVPIIITIYTLAPTRIYPLILWIIAALVCIFGSAVFGTIDISMYRKLKQFADRSRKFQVVAAVVFLIAIFRFGL
jgi:exopolysaccharide production protein ExoZ